MQSIGPAKDIAAVRIDDFSQVGLGLHPVQDAANLSAESGRLADVFSPGVLACSGEQDWDVLNGRQARQAQPQVVIEHEVVIQIEITRLRCDPLQGRAAHKHSRLADDAKAQQFAQLQLPKESLFNG